jgi:hypothetical protein
LIESVGHQPLEPVQALEREVDGRIRHAW